MTNRWLINDIEFSGQALGQLAKANGETYKIKSDGKFVTMERVYNNGIDSDQN